MNLLTYDYHSSYEPAVNHHSPLYPLEEDSEYNFDAKLNIVILNLFLVIRLPTKMHTFNIMYYIICKNIGSYDQTLYCRRS